MFTNCFLVICIDNKRLDEWVTLNRLNIDRLQMPKKEKTPVKDGKCSSSRASTPERDMVRGHCVAGIEELVCRDISLNEVTGERWEEF